MIQVNKFVFSLILIPAWAFSNCLNIFISETPSVQQAKWYWCGAASVESALRKQGVFIPGGQHTIAALNGLDHYYIFSPPILVNFVKQYGVFAEQKCFQTAYDIQNYLLAGESVIVGWNWDGTPHYSVAKGVDNSFIYLMDPWYNKPTTSYDWSYFLKGWYPNPAVSHCPGMVIRISRYPLR
jgi:predicted double-glycine peptidase